eukprot:TRINITY_DN24876_c0_g1_i1.p1 TRINITY_DN24876_c0_g1~~TRINITY_DN24876_c0_g1_i1.p1  ORF type:complete len:697 (+),score=101.13 TRINITY_DN24876_c0_g1_i1:63-2093(+)
MGPSARPLGHPEKAQMRQKPHMRVEEKVVMRRADLLGSAARGGRIHCSANRGRGHHAERGAGGARAAVPAREARLEQPPQPAEGKALKGGTEVSSEKGPARPKPRPAAMRFAAEHLAQQVKRRARAAFFARLRRAAAPRAAERLCSRVHIALLRRVWATLSFAASLRRYGARLHAVADDEALARQDTTGESAADLAIRISTALHREASARAAAEASAAGEANARAEAQDHARHAALLQHAAQRRHTATVVRESELEEIIAVQRGQLDSLGVEHAAALGRLELNCVGAEQPVALPLRPYRFVSCLSRGTSAMVIKVEDSQQDEWAVKILPLRSGNAGGLAPTAELGVAAYATGCANLLGLKDVVVANEIHGLPSTVLDDVMDSHDPQPGEVVRVKDNGAEGTVVQYDDRGNLILIQFANGEYWVERARVLRISSTASAVGMVMTVASETLAERTARTGALPAAEIEQVLVETARALRFLRRGGKCHWDAHVHNVLSICDNGVTHWALGDFGRAKPHSERGEQFDAWSLGLIGAMAAGVTALGTELGPGNVPWECLHLVGTPVVSAVEAGLPPDLRVTPMILSLLREVVRRHEGAPGADSTKGDLLSKFSQLESAVDSRLQSQAEGRCAVTERLRTHLRCTQHAPDIIDEFKSDDEDAGEDCLDSVRVFQSASSWGAT